MAWEPVNKAAGSRRLPGGQACKLRPKGLPGEWGGRRVGGREGRRTWWPQLMAKPRPRV